MPREPRIPRDLDVVRKLDKVVVVDVEATCWEGKPPSGQESEIIEVGVCVVDVASGERLEKDSILVKPQRSRVSEFCTRLTTLTPEQVEAGVGFGEACHILRQRYLSHQRVWASYGEYDRKQFERQCESFGVGYPFGSRHVNVKTLLALMCALPYEVGMVQGLELLSLPLEGTHHRGGDDAWNIAGILGKLLWHRMG